MAIIIFHIRPIIGGILSTPASRWPKIFGRIAFFQAYPYFLPCAVAALIAFASVPMAIFWLKEVKSW
jgi:hypothetical protein